jgi:hypothetical protein
MANHHERYNFIWQIADLLRRPYRPPQDERSREATNCRRTKGTLGEDQGGKKIVAWQKRLQAKELLLCHH